MYCPKCGAENVDGSAICSACSFQLVTAAPQEMMPPAQAKVSRLAITALVLGILSILGCFITALPAIIFGIVALVKIGKSGGQLKGKGLAITGLTLPTVAILLMLLLMPALSRVKAMAQQVICGVNMEGLAVSTIIYAQDNEHRFPTVEKWCDLLIEHTDVVEQSFHCPAGLEQTFSYGFNSNLDGLTYDEVGPDVVMLFEIEGGRNVAGGPELLLADRHKGQGCNVVFVDGHLELVRIEDMDKLKWTVGDD